MGGIIELKEAIATPMMLPDECDKSAHWPKDNNEKRKRKKEKNHQ
jgi:hypothetical protein